MLSFKWTGIVRRKELRMVQVDTRKPKKGGTFFETRRGGLLSLASNKKPELFENSVYNSRVWLRVKGQSQKCVQ